MKAIEEAVRSDAPATRVVVVEDDQASADVLQRRLQANGMVVSVAHDGKRGIELVEELLPDLVLLDVMLPDTDGYDVCLRIKSNTATSPIPVIFLSARGEVVDKVRGLSCGAADYMSASSHGWRSPTRRFASTSSSSSFRDSISRMRMTRQTWSSSRGTRRSPRICPRTSPSSV